MQGCVVLIQNYASNVLVARARLTLRKGSHIFVKTQDFYCYLQQHVNGLDRHELKNVVLSAQDVVKLELDQRPDQVKELVDLVARELRQNLNMTLERMGIVQVS